MAKKAEKPKLNPKQEKFVQGLIKGMNLTDSYLAAGYGGHGSKNADYAGASQLLRNIKVLEALADRRRAQKEAGNARLHEMIDGASNVFIRLLKMETTDPLIMKLQKETAKDIWDMTGFKPTDKTELSGTLDMGINFILRDGTSEEDI